MSHPEPAWIRVWEEGHRLGDVGRALTLLGLVRPEEPRDALSQLPLGECERLLLDLHERAFGSRIEGDGTCPACGERVEYAFACAELAARGATSAPSRVEVDGFRVHFRPLTSADLEALAGFTDAGEARRHLAARCVSEATHDGEPVDPAALPEHVLVALSAAMEASDPLAETLLRLRCPACETVWKESFTALHSAWRGVARAAGDLMRQVHTLALHYHWSEAEILALSPERRAYYLRLVAA